MGRSLGTGGRHRRSDFSSGTDLKIFIGGAKEASRRERVGILRQDGIVDSCALKEAWEWDQCTRGGGCYWNKWGGFSEETQIPSETGGKEEGSGEDGEDSQERQRVLIFLDVTMGSLRD